MDWNTCNRSNAFFANSCRAAAIDGKFVVRLSPIAYNLLSLFLVQSDLVLVASIINNKVAFKKLDSGGVESGEEDPVVLVELPGYTPGTFCCCTSDIPALCVAIFSGGPF